MAAQRRQFFSLLSLLLCLACLAVMFQQCARSDDNVIVPKKGAHIVLIGNNLCSRMMNFGHFETGLHLRFPDSLLLVRNICDGGNTPGFRPHSGRESPWAFPGAEEFQIEMAANSGSEGHFETPDEWLGRLKADIIIAFFGYTESFNGVEGIDIYKTDLQAFINHTLKQDYNDKTPPELVIVSPIAFQDLSNKYDLPNGQKENKNLALYTNAMREISMANNVKFVDAFNPSRRWYSSEEELTTDGSQLNEPGYEIFSNLLVRKIFGPSDKSQSAYKQLVHEAVLEKNWFWHNDFKIPNGVHVFGRRYEPFGPDNYPAELIKVREMTSIRDEAIWGALKGEVMDLKSADDSTMVLPQIETNYNLGESENPPEYKYGQDALSSLTAAPGYKIDLFASEAEFPDLANPVQLSFDNAGRLWVAVMPSYPHYKPGDTRPDDKLLILEDTDGDGKADKQTIFADGLHLPIGFEFAPEGVYVSQGTNLKLYTDTDGDDKADRIQIILSGFDDHDTHHAISAFCADPSGAIYMGEGVFLHTNVETSYGTVRATNGGFYRFNPQRRHLERTAQLSIPNPWGIAFDEWGQNFFAETSGPDVLWMMPGTVKPRYGKATPKSRNLIEDAHRVRPTSGLEFIYSRHFPDEVQGDLLINNTIGFLGTKQHSMEDDGTGYRSLHRQDLVSATDPNFRPVDMEFAPDGSLYVVDWHNILIGHMQHNARDPLRDHAHGRIYRITYPSRPLVTPANVIGASIPTLLDNLKLHEYRTRYRTRRELRGRDVDAVLESLVTWIAALDAADPRYEHHLLEALWGTWGLNRINQPLMRQLLNASDFRVRAAAVRVLRYTGHQVKDQSELLLAAAADDHPRVRLEVIVASSWLGKDDGLSILAEVAQSPLNDWMEDAFRTALEHVSGNFLPLEKEDTIETHLEGDDLVKYTRGKEIYMQDGYCSTCHQPDGMGLQASGYPPLSGTRWTMGDEDQLIKLTLNGLHGPIEVNGIEYPGLVPMTPFKGLLDDEEIAAVLTYVRNSFGNIASVVAAEKVKIIRAETAHKSGFYSPKELLEMYPAKSE